MIEELWNACNDIGRFLTVPAIYRHFKEFKDDEEMIYAVSNVSIPIDIKEFKTNEKCSGLLFFWHTELETKVPIYRFGNRYYHDNSIDNDILVIYTGLYGSRETYVRPLKMFLSKIDKEKYPNSNKKYRLELVN